jgi:P4 family phage/plasmid primase-like protien
MKPEQGTLAARFHALFAGAEDAYGTYNDIAPDETRTDGKQKGKAVTLRGRVTDELWQRHLDGRNGLGIVPIREDGTCLFGGIDIDVYGLNHAETAVKLNKVAPAIMPCRSKSAGCHGYLFAKEPVPAAKMQGALRAIAARMGLGDSEIFPKQSEKASADDFGSWINMPYADGDSTTRFAVKLNGDPYSMEEFLATAEARKVDAEWFAQPLSQSAPNTDLPDGPPCLQHLMELGFPPGTWNSGCLNLGIYCKKASPDNWKDQLVQLNAKNFPADRWPSSDLNGIIKSLSKEEYRYQCNKAPLAQYCNRELCQTRKFGIGTSTKSFVDTLADAILAMDSFARDKGDLLYLFQEGVYKPTGERFIKARVKALCIELQRSKEWSPQLAEKVTEWIATDAPQLWEMPPLDTLNCHNGLLDVATRTLRPHAPEFLSAVQIPVHYDPQAGCPHIDKFIASTFPEDAQHLPFEICSWLMTPDVSIQKAVLLLGEGANGKSVFLTLLLNFLGMENVSTLSLHRIEGDKFSAARLVGKLANFGMDLPSKELTGTSVFKALCGGDVIVGERKFESSFEFRPFARLIFSANTAPRSDDSSHGFFRRWLTIQFEKTFNETDPDTVPRAVLDARLAEPKELSGLLNRALDKLPVIRRGAFTECESTRRALQQFRETTDPLSVWLHGNTVDKVESFVTKDTLRRAYSQACQEHGRPIMNDVQFTSALRRLKPKVELSRRMVDGRRVQVFVGLGMVSGDQEPVGMF